MAYARNVNNPLAIWTAFNGVMGDNVTFDYGEPDFAFVVSMDAAYLTFGFRIEGVFSIDWGDGTSNDYSLTWGIQAVTHRYSGEGEYTVSINGEIRDMSFLYWGVNVNLYVYYQRLKRILTPLPRSFADKKDFEEMFCCCALLEEVPEDLFINCPNAETFSYCFAGHISQNNGALTQVAMTISGIPAGLFRHCPKAKDLSGCFCMCKSVTSIPAELFLNQTEVVSFESCFSCCTTLQSIPETLFHNCPEVTNFASCFGGYRYTTMRNYVRGNHISTIPANLFANCHKVTSFNNTFGLNTYLTSIPAGLFDSCPLVTDFSYCFGGFYYKSTQYCYPKIAAIPADLFANCPLVTSFSECFSGCTTLTAVPSDIFASNPNVELFVGTFSHCTKVTGSMPALWLSHGSANGTTCFESCTKAANYTSIPSGWK